MDTLAHHYLLIEYDDTRGLPHHNNIGLRWFGFAGALFAELQLRNRLVSVGADKFAVASGEPHPGLLGEAEAAVTSRWPRPAQWCLYQLYQKTFRLRKVVRTELAEAGELERTEDKVLGLTWRVRWPRGAGTVEVELLAHLRNWAETVRPEDAPGREELLVSLLRGTDLLEQVWSESELERLKPLLDERTRLAPVGRLVRDLAVHGGDMARYRPSTRRGPAKLR